MQRRREVIDHYGVGAVDLAESLWVVFWMVESLSFWRPDGATHGLVANAATAATLNRSPPIAPLVALVDRRRPLSLLRTEPLTPPREAAVAPVFGVGLRQAGGRRVNRRAS